jgi:hypothetical protein
MWVKKSPEELRKSFSKKRRLLGALAFGTMLFLMCVFTNGKGWVRTGSFFKHQLSDMVNSVPIALLISTITGLISYWLLFRETPSPNGVLLCQKCEKTKFDDGTLDCPCGGHFEDIQTMKWVTHSEPSQK